MHVTWIPEKEDMKMEYESNSAKSGRFVVLCYTQFSHWHLKRPCCAVDSRERRFPPTSPTKQNFVSKLSLLFEDLSTYQNPCFAQLFWWLYGVLERRHFMRSQDGKKWRPHERLSIFSSRIFRFFPITLDLLEQKEKVKMLQNNLLGR